MKRELIRKWLFMIGHLALLTGLLCSKALVSIGSVTIVFSALLYVSQEPRTLFTPPRQVIGFIALFLAPFISGIWSSNITSWMEIMLNKIMLPALAWAYWLSPPLSKKEYYSLSLTNIVLVLVGTFYSVGHYVLSPDLVNESYLRAKTLKVMYLDDHLHFSLWIIVTLCLILHDWKQLLSIGKRYGQIIFGSILLWLIVFLHILGAKTGLVLLYLGLFYWVVHQGVGQIKPIKWLVVPAAIGALLFSYFFIPTFKNRIHYTLYDFNQYAQGSFINGLTDGARVLSWKAGSEIATAHPWIGVGFGDLHDTFQAWHTTHSAHLEPYNWLQPSDEWLMYWCGSGWFGMMMLCLGLWWIYKFSSCDGDRIFRFLFIVQVLMMWYEVNLSNQISITLFVFSLSWLQLADRISLRPGE